MEVLISEILINTMTVIIQDKARYDTSRYSSMQSLRYSSGIASSYPSTLTSVASLSEAAGLNEVSRTTSYAQYKNGCNMRVKTNCSPTSDVFTVSCNNLSFYIFSSVPDIVFAFVFLHVSFLSFCSPPPFFFPLWFRHAQAIIK